VLANACAEYGRCATTFAQSALTSNTATTATRSDAILQLHSITRGAPTDTAATIASHSQAPLQLLQHTHRHYCNYYEYCSTLTRATESTATALLQLHSLQVLAQTVEHQDSTVLVKVHIPFTGIKKGKFVCACVYAHVCMYLLHKHTYS